MDISVVIPLYNEEESLPELFAWIGTGEHDPNNPLLPSPAPEKQISQAAAKRHYHSAPSGHHPHQRHGEGLGMSRQTRGAEHQPHSSAAQYPERPPEPFIPEPPEENLLALMQIGFYCQKNHAFRIG